MDPPGLFLPNRPGISGRIRKKKTRATGAASSGSGARRPGGNRMDMTRRLPPSIRKGLPRFAPWLWPGRALAFFLFFLTALIVLSYGGALLEFFSYLHDERLVQSLSREARLLERIDIGIGRVRLAHDAYLVSGKTSYLVAYTTGIERLFQNIRQLKRIRSRAKDSGTDLALRSAAGGFDPSLLSQARDLERRGLMETRTHFLKEDLTARLLPIQQSLARALLQLRTEEWHRRRSARVHLLGTSTLFGISFLLFSTFLGVTAGRITRDIASVSQLVTSLYHDSHHDTLTGLPNRASVLDALDRLLSAPPKGRGFLALLYIDLDGFKAVNDRLGHDKGDLALVAVSRRFKRVIPDGDILARMGGDEFLLLIPFGEGPDIPGKVASRLIGALSDPLDIAGKPAVLGASIGIAFFPSDGNTSETLIKKADEAMYRAKTAGGNRFQFAGEKPQDLGSFSSSPDA